MRANAIAWDDYFMGIALLSAQRSKDPNTQVGACVVKDKKIVGVGYNGFPVGCPDDQLPWGKEGEPDDTKYAYVCHAELNAICNKGTESLKGATIYTTLFPCNECAKLIIQMGISKVIYLKYKECAASMKMFDMVGVECVKHSAKQNFVCLSFLDEEPVTVYQRTDEKVLVEDIQHDEYGTLEQDLELVGENMVKSVLVDYERNEAVRNTDLRIYITSPSRTRIRNPST